LTTQLTELVNYLPLAIHTMQWSWVWFYHLLQFLRFLGAVGIGTALYYLAYFALTELGMWYIFSSVLSFALCYSTTFLFHKFWAFKGGSVSGIHGQIINYTAMVLLLFALNTIYLYFLVEYLSMWYLTAQVVASIILTPLSFWATKRIFR
jgi:putative flippase GtrA